MTLGNMCSNDGLRSPAMIVGIFLFSRLSISTVCRVISGLLYIVNILISLSFTFIYTVEFSTEVVRIVITWCIILFRISIAAPPDAWLPVTVVLFFCQNISNV